MLGCEPVACFTPPQTLLLDLTNTAGENLITIEKLKFSDIKAVDKSSNNSERINLREGNYISIESAGWHDGTKHYIFYTPLDTFSLSITSHEIDTKNCGGYAIDDIELNRESKEENGIIKVVLKD